MVASPNETVAAIAMLATNPGPDLMAVAFMCLAYSIARPQWVPRRWVIILLLVEPVLNALATATNPWHLWVYSGAGASQLTGSAGWTFGPVYWFDNWYIYLEMAIGLGLVAWAWWSASPAFRAQRLALFLAALIPLAANAIFLAGAFGDIVDPTPFGFAVTGAMVWFAIFRQDLFTFAPVARAVIIDQIGDALSSSARPAGSWTSTPRRSSSCGDSSRTLPTSWSGPGHRSLSAQPPPPTAGRPRSWWSSRAAAPSSRCAPPG